MPIFHVQLPFDHRPDYSEDCALRTLMFMCFVTASSAEEAKRKAMPLILKNVNEQDEFHATQLYFLYEWYCTIKGTLAGIESYRVCKHCGATDCKVEHTYSDDVVPEPFTMEELETWFLASSEVTVTEVVCDQLFVL